MKQSRSTDASRLITTGYFYVYLIICHTQYTLTTDDNIKLFLFDRLLFKFSQAVACFETIHKLHSYSLLYMSILTKERN